MFQKRTIRRLIVVLLAAAALGTLALFGLSTASAQGPGGQGTPAPGCDFGAMMGWRGGMMGGRGQMMGQGALNSPEICAQMGHMMNMMGGPMMGSMMGNWDADRFGPGTGMMGAWTPPAELRPTAGKTLTLESAAKIAEAYIAAWQTERKLQLGHLMQFSDNFYGQAIEADSNRGAFEFLIDPQSGTVYGEPGPNMMWNLRYGVMGYGMGMWRLAESADKGETITVTPEKAREYAQAFLDQAFPGAKLTEEITSFYGYYTLDFAREGKIAGMLSVNGFTGQVWYHHWHGDFVAEAE